MNQRPLYYLRTPWTEPEENLAFEEYLLREVRSGDVFLLWQNRPSVIIGRNQIAEEEVNLNYAAGHDIRVVRRSTGGGAVYHDLGNVNYSFFTDLNTNPPRHMSDYAEPVVSALRSLGVNVSFSGRNDILINGRKVCGTAERIDGGRILSHGCMMFDVDIEVMLRVLTPPEEKLTRHGIASVKSRVANLADYLPEMTVEDFISKLAKLIPGEREVLPLHYDEDRYLKTLDSFSGVIL